MKKTCSVCGEEALSQMTAYQKHHLSKCRSCTMVLAHLEPHKRTLEEHYAQYGRDDFFSPITKQRYNEWLDTFEEYREHNRILDVGCGIGFFLETALERNWEVFGTEYTDESVNICEQKGIQMYKGEIENIEFNDLKFDVVVSIEVLEHISNPLSHLERINQILRPGGTLYLTTPNFNSLNRRILGERWNVLAYPEHLSYFNKKSLNMALSKSGFVKKQLITEGISLEHLKTSIQKKNVDHSTPDTSDERLRQAAESYYVLKKFKFLANYLLNVVGLGESLKAFYYKS